jgi:hypothetical protein
MNYATIADPILGCISDFFVKVPQGTSFAENKYIQSTL